MIKFNLEQICGYVFSVFTALATIIVPSILYFSIMSNMTSYEDMGAFFTNITQLIIISISLGCFTTIATLLAYYFKSFSFTRLVFLFIIEILYSIDIVVWSGIGRIGLETSSSYIFLDQSIFYYYFLGIPILLVIRSIYNFKNARDKWKDYYIVLKTIFTHTKIHNPSQINKFICTLNLENELLNELLKNTTSYINYFKKLEIVKRSENYKLTAKGKRLLNQLEKIKMYQDLRLAFYDYKNKKFEVWTEEDLKKTGRN